MGARRESKARSRRGLPLVLAALVLVGAACSTTSDDDSKDDSSSDVPTESGKGVSDSTITLGVELLDVGAAAAAEESAGVESAESSNQEATAIVEAVVDGLNTDGGVAGRDVEVVFHFTNIGEGTFENRDQETCAAFTEDNEVFAVVTLANGTIGLAECLANADTPVVWDQGVSWPFDQGDLEALAPYLYLPTKVNLSRFGAYVNGLADQGFFEPDSVVGLVRYDLPSHDRAVEEVIVPALEEQGLSLAQDFAFTPANSVDDLTNVSVQAANAVVQFRDAGVDRVLFLPTAQVIPLLFPIVAEVQDYRPRYGISTADAPDFMATSVPDAQLEGALGVGWDPLKDLGLENGADVIGENEIWSRCEELLVGAGLPEEGAQVCSPFLFLQEALDGVDGVNPDSLRAGVDALGTTEYSAVNFGTDWAADVYDGPSEMRPLAYDAGCDCFQYTGEPVPIPR